MSENGSRLAKAALAKNNTTVVTILGDYETDRSRFQSLGNSLEVTYDVNNNVASNGVKDAVIANTNLAHGHTNKSILDATTASYTIAIDLHVADLESRLAALELALANYTIHTHSYNDRTISDTADGTGITTDTPRSTGGVV